MKKQFELTKEMKVGLANAHSNDGLVAFLKMKVEIANLNLITLAANNKPEEAAKCAIGIEIINNLLNQIDTWYNNTEKINAQRKETSLHKEAGQAS